jgi:hypothetical protein
MKYSPYEARELLPAIQAAEAFAAKHGTTCVLPDVHGFPVVDPADLDALELRRPGWIVSREVYAAIHKAKVPTQTHAIRLGKQLAKRYPHTRMYGPLRAYWIMPAGVEPDYHTA